MGGKVVRCQDFDWNVLAFAKDQTREAKLSAPSLLSEGAAHCPACSGSVARLNLVMVRPAWCQADINR